MRRRSGSVLDVEGPAPPGRSHSLFRALLLRSFSRFLGSAQQGRIAERSR